MNTRLQVEHPVTELTTGLDLVRLQIEVAQGGRIPRQDEIVRRGHAIEARIYAEDPSKGFIPSPGRINYLRIPSGPGIRDDSGVYGGWTVPQFYDPMLSKLLAWAPTRDEAIARLVRALEEYVITGITANVGYLARVLEHPAFRSGDYDTGLLREVREGARAPRGSEARDAGGRRGGHLGAHQRPRRGRGLRRAQRPERRHLALGQAGPGARAPGPGMSPRTPGGGSR